MRPPVHGSRHDTLMRAGALATMLLACAVSTTATAGAASVALARSLDIRELAASITVLRNGGIRVTERITVHFEGEWNGLYRTIPVEYRTPQNLRYALDLRVESVMDAAGNPLRYEVERAGRSRRIKMWVPGAVDATHTIVLTYRSSNALRFFEEHDELYWNVTGDEWDFPIKRTRAEIILPEDVEGIRAAAFAGVHGSDDPVTAAEQVGNAVYFHVDRPMGYREGLTVVVGWNPGVVERPTLTARAGRMLAANSVLAIPFFAFFAMFGIWRRYGKDPETSVYVRYEPPPDMTPAEAGTLIDDRPDVRDITATLVDLAVRGYLRIEETKRDQLFGLFSTTDYELTLLREDDWPRLKPHEAALLRALRRHADDGRVAFSDLQNEFYRDLPEIRNHLKKTLVDGGHYHRRPDVVRGVWFAAAVAAGAAVAAFASMLAARLHIAGVAILFAAVTTAVIVIGFGWLMPVRTRAGARSHAWVRGFEEFLARVEKDRLERMIESPTDFEKYLPYAMAFGVEKNWARAFDGLASEPPDWYRGADGGPFRPNHFVGRLGRMTTAASSAMTSSPRGSGSSGSSGFSGGSSGGGFGGGGGGGF
jgi:uncharacterized membrane protein